jgi:hypothetical protein
LLVLASLISAPLLGQSHSVTKPKSLRPFVAQGAKPHHTAEAPSDTLSVVIYKATRGDEGRFTRVGSPINPAQNHVFKSGEFLLVSFTPTFESYVYFVNRGPEGTRVIFPREAGDIQAIRPGETRNQPLAFNSNVGREELIVVISRDRLSKLDDAISRSDRMLVPEKSSSTETVYAAADNKEPATVRRIRSGKKTVKVFSRAGLIAANTPRWSVVDSISSTASGTVASSSRGLECLQDEGTSSVQIRPVRDAKGSYRYGAGQVGAFSISFDHR